MPARLAGGAAIKAEIRTPAKDPDAGRAPAGPEPSAFSLAKRAGGATLPAAALTSAAAPRRRKRPRDGPPPNRSIAMHLPRTFLARACLLLLLCLPIAALCHAGRPAAAQPAAVDAAAVAAALPAFESYVEGFMAASGIPGVAIGIVAEDRLLHARGFGTREAGGTVPVDADTLFQIGSITKSFAAGTEAVLVDRGLLRWDDRVIDHVPGFRMYDPWVTAEFRIVDLLAQRSGMPPYVLGEMVVLGYSRQQMIDAIRHVEPVGSFRGTFGYQNVLHLVAEQAVMQASGAESWEAFLHDALLQPLGMTATGNTAAAIAASANRAMGHSRAGGSVRPIPFWPEFYEVGAAGNINSNVADMSRWLRLQINRGEIDGKRVVGEAALTHTWRPQVAVTDTASYASGLVAQADSAGRLVWHNGGTHGFASFLGFDPDRRVGIVVLTNLALPGAGDAIGNRFLDMVRGLPETDHAGILLAAADAREEAVRRVLHEAPAAPRPARPMPDYAGSYDNPIFGRATVAPDGAAALVLTIGPQHTKIRLTPRSGDGFAAHFPDHRDLGMDDPMGFVQFEPGTLDGVRAFSLDLDTGALDSPERPRFLKLEE